MTCNILWLIGRGSFVPTSKRFKLRGHMPTYETILHNINHMSTYEIILCNINYMSTYETILCNINDMPTYNNNNNNSTIIKCLFIVDPIHLQNFHYIP